MATCIFNNNFSTYALGVLSEIDGFLADDTHPMPDVVSSASDGGPGPFEGNRMLRLNAFGAWPARDFQTVKINTDNYTDELFIRAWVRLDTNWNVGDPIANFGQKYLRIFKDPPYVDIYTSARWDSGSFMNGSATVNGSLTTYWGGLDDCGSDRINWHKIEYYINDNTEHHKVWIDDVLVIERGPGGLNFPATKWSPFYLGSNGEDSDSTNYFYVGKIEIFSDASTGTTTTGTMLDASIAVNAAPPPPPPPSGLTLTLNWTNGSLGVTSNIERCDGVGCSTFTPLATTAIDATSFVDTTVVPGVTYCYRVNNQNANGISSYSNTACGVPVMPSISVSPSNISFDGVVGGPLPAAVTVTVTTSNGVPWQSADTCSFFDASPTSGPSGGTQTLTPSAGWSSLPAGTTTCQITYSATGATSLPVTVSATKSVPVSAPTNLQVTP